MGCWHCLPGLVEDMLILLVVLMFRTGQERSANGCPMS